MALISDRKPEVLLELGNRSDLSDGTPSRLDKWFRDSYIELAMNVPLETLEASSEGVLDNTPGDGIFDLPAGARLPKCIAISTSGTGKFYDGTVGAVVALDYKDISTIRKMTSLAAGAPSVYTLYGGKVIMRPRPDKAYPIMWDYWALPTINATIADTELLVPDDWLEIVDMGALLRGFKSLQERDKARELQELLYGFKTPSGKAVPGYITYRQTQQQAGSEFENYGLQPRTRRYTG